MYDDPQNPDTFDDQQFDPRKKSANTGITGGMDVSLDQPAPVSPWDRTGFRDSWMGTGNNVGAQDALLKQYGINLSGNGTGTLPSGEIMDLRRGARAGDNTAQWMGVGEMRNGQASYYPPGGGAAPQASPVGGGGGQLDGAFRDALLKAMQGANTPYDANAPQNASQQNAYNVQRDRAAQQERAAMAERSAFNGLNSGGAGSGGFETGLQGIYENAGQDKAGQAAQLAQQDYQAKRQDLAHALDLANSVGARQEAAALQMQLSQLDNQYRYAALGQQQGQFEDQMAYNWTDWQTNQNRQNLLTGMGGGGF